ncbi:siderophore-iron reductase FhuF [Guyparkeria hydrothermalis]|uniref:siderophore-iron reductase FhuF n=1 Tax=Guyparkeria hydrothermalis TaxID=923 RepID=UPI0020224366|nr:siderophore-iron reductase FhuF [Guyparkeria hydrothermalis]MCL7744392.1 siderophore-iron reductase FhuF [Guyparkeria hydrothermalis]
MAIFRSVFSGPLARLPRPVLGEWSGEGVSLTLRQLRDPSALAVILERFAPNYPGGDRRAVASMWSKWFFNAVLPPVVGLLLAERRACIADDASVGVIIDASARPSRFWLRESGDITDPVSVETGMERLVRERLSPVVEALSVASGASRNVFWSNAGNSVEYLVGEMARHPAITPATLQVAYAFFECRRFGDGLRNPLSRPVRYRAIADESRGVERQRRVCCIRYLLPEVSYCANCPLACRRTDEASTGGACRTVRHPSRGAA